MNQFGDDLIIESPEVPLLIWVQLLVVLLLLSLISRSATLLSPSSTSPAPNLPSSSSSSSSNSIKSPSRRNRESSLAVRPSRSFQVGGDVTRRAGREAIEVSACAAERVGTGREEDERIRLERSSSLSSTGEEVRRDAFHHHCNFVRLAGMAFIKCFGLDSK